MLILCKAVAYIRVSTEQQKQYGAGLEIQKQQIQEYCQKNKIKLVEVFSDEAVSGAKENREGINQLLEYIAENKIDRVIIQKYDRLSRDTYYGLWIRKELKKLEVELLSIAEESFSGTDPINELMQNIIYSFAEFEKSRISERMLSGRKKKANSGKKASGNTPFGYKYKYDESGINQGVIIDLKEAEIVKQIFKDKANGLSLQNIKDKLDSQGIVTSRGNQYSRQTIQHIIKNKFYIGIVQFDEIEKQGEHEPIISKVLFGKANSK